MIHYNTTKSFKFIISLSSIKIVDLYKLFLETWAPHKRGDMSGHVTEILSNQEITDEDGVELNGFPSAV